MTQERADASPDEARRARQREYAAAYREANREKIRAQDRAKHFRHREKRLAAAKKWAAENRSKVNERQRRYRGTPEGTLNNRIRVRMHEALKRGWAFSSLKDLGWTAAELRVHLERQFLPGMNWGNMGEWHIDHIVPLSSFKTSKEDGSDLRSAWALTNLRPIWAKDNLAKSNKRVTLL